MDQLRELYEDMILDHNRRPRNYLKPLEQTNHSAHGFNPLCGDDFTVHLQVKDGIIEDASFEGSGCAISTASASLMTESIVGKSVADAQRLFETMRRMLSGQDAVDASLGKLRILAGVHAFPMRIKCATLAWHTLKAALENAAGTVSTE